MIAFNGKRLDEMEPDKLREALDIVARLPYAGMSEARIEAAAQPTREEVSVECAKTPGQNNRGFIFPQNRG